MQSSIPIDDMAGIVAAYREARSYADQWRDAADKLKSALEQHLARFGATRGTVDGETVCTRTEHTRRTFQAKKFRAEYPDLADQFTAETSVTRFTVSGDQS